jgi:hypothetical protein
MCDLDPRGPGQRSVGGWGYVHTVTNIQVPQKSGDSFTSQISDRQLVKDNVLHKASYLV